MVFVKILVLIAAILLALVLIRYRLQLVRIVGKNYYAEKYLGQGGSYTFWILFAILIIFVALVWLVGVPGCKKI